MVAGCVILVVQGAGSFGQIPSFPVNQSHGRKRGGSVRRLLQSARILAACIVLVGPASIYFLEGLARQITLTVQMKGMGAHARHNRLRHLSGVLCLAFTISSDV